MTTFIAVSEVRNNWVGYVLKSFGACPYQLSYQCSFSCHILSLYSMYGECWLIFFFSTKHFNFSKQIFNWQMNRNSNVANLQLLSVGRGKLHPSNLQNIPECRKINWLAAVDIYISFYLLKISELGDFTRLGSNSSWGLFFFR